MRPTLRSFVVLVLLSGCASESPPPEKTAAKPATSAPSSTKPAAKPAPAKAAEPAAEPQDDSVIVVKSRHHKDASGSSAGGSSGASDPARDARIAELKAQAEASQGKDNGQPVRASETAKPASASSGSSGRRKQIEDRLAAIDKEASDLRGERAGHVHTEAGREGRFRVNREVADDPERVSAIDARLKELDGEKAELSKELASLPPEKKK